LLPKKPMASHFFIQMTEKIVGYAMIGPFP